jgi:hypothetical protein
MGKHIYLGKGHAQLGDKGSNYSVYKKKVSGTWLTPT